MRILLTLCCLLASSLAWEGPERCSENKRSKRSVSDKTEAQVVTSIEQVVINQQKFLKEAYKNHKFYGIPVGTLEVIEGPGDPKVSIYAPYDCTFYTHDPRLLASVACHDPKMQCKLSRTVATEETYKQLDGYNWNTKISGGFSFKKIFEIGGKYSSNKTFQCSFNKGRSTSDSVECAINTARGTLQLYYVHSDLKCDFGRITLESDARDRYSAYTQLDKSTFTAQEAAEIYNLSRMKYKYMSVSSLFDMNKFMIDTDQISRHLYSKIMRVLPLFNAYTDFLSVFIKKNPAEMWIDGAYYYTPTSAESEYREVIPFTNENGDSVYQYSCLLTPL